MPPYQPPIFSIVINSEGHQFKGDFTAKLVEPILLNHNRKYLVQLLKATIPISWFNVVSPIEFSIDYGGGVLVSAFLPAGNWNVDLVQTFIRNLIEVNKIGAVVSDDFSLTPVVYIGVLEMKVGTNGLRVDVGNNGLAELLGFVPNTIVATDTQGTTHPTFNSKVKEVQIGCDLVANMSSIASGKRSNVIRIAGVPCNKAPFESFEIIDNVVEGLPLQKYDIESINMRVYNQDGNVIDLGTSDCYFHLYIIEVPVNAYKSDQPGKTTYN